VQRTCQTDERLRYEIFGSVAVVDEHHPQSALALGDYDVRVIGAHTGAPLR
jgi:hypothetical protein